jgi:hypothetical protein
MRRFAGIPSYYLIDNAEGYRHTYCLLAVKELTCSGRLHGGINFRYPRVLFFSSRGEDAGFNLLIC